MGIRVGFFGRGQLGLDCLKILLDNSNFEIACIFTTIHSREIGGSPADFAKIAKIFDIPFFYTQDINDPEVVSIIENSNIEFGITCLWVNTLTDIVCRTANKGFINIHSGPLPKYRGNACANWAILNKEEYFGVAVHFMEPNILDSGPIIADCRFEIKGLDITQISKVVYEKSVELFKISLDRILDNKFTGRIQDDSNASICFPRTELDGCIDWYKNAEDVDLLIKSASKPYPGAFTFYKDNRNALKKVRIYKSAITHIAHSMNAIPGQIIVDANRLLVVTGEGLIEIMDFEVEEDANFSSKLQFGRRSRFLNGNTIVDKELIDLEPKISYSFSEKMLNRAFFFFTDICCLSFHLNVTKNKKVSIESKEIWDNWQAKNIFCRNRYYRSVSIKSEKKVISVGIWMEKNDRARILKLYLTTNMKVLTNDLSPYQLLPSEILERIPLGEVVFRGGIGSNHWVGWSVPLQINLYTFRRILRSIFKQDFN